MRIKQCKMLNDSMYNRFSYFLKKYSVKKYNNFNIPSVFFSLWGYGAIKNHKSLAVIVWRGTDIVKMESRLKSIKKRKNIYHVSISSYISKDLDKYGIKYKFIPIVGVNNKYFKPTEMGDEIYMYIPHNNEKYNNRYGRDIVKKIRKKCKYKINIVKSGQYSRKKLVNIYKRCFCGFRFTRHDGLPNQVIEMGLMGRKSFYNGGIPGSIKWDQKVDNILNNIEKESEKIGTIDYDYSSQINDFVKIKNNWLDTKFWNNN